MCIHVSVCLRVCACGVHVVSLCVCVHAMAYVCVCVCVVRLISEAITAYSPVVMIGGDSAKLYVEH